MQQKFLSLCFLLLLLSACKEKSQPVTTPWGTVLGADSVADTEGYSLSDIVNNGELIMLTLSGPDTYYDYQGRGMGVQYLLCERFAKSIGVSLRVDICRDTTELLNRLRDNEGDIVANVISLHDAKDLVLCGPLSKDKQQGWVVKADNSELAKALNRWYKPELLAQVESETRLAFSQKRLKHNVYAPILNKKKGVISSYDHLFQQHAAVARMDWRLMAAQCYQESTFDPNAKSWAGACGLMQIMPTTADYLGLSRSLLFSPEHNIAAAARFLNELDAKFSHIPNRLERICFVLASYNAGPNHILDAMALTRKQGGNPTLWRDVSANVLRLQYPQYYRDPVVKYGYMRGTETVTYVERILDRWNQYRGVASGGSSSFGSAVPQPAKRKHRFHL